MRLLSVLLTSAMLFAQAPLIGVNSAAAKLPAGARDIVASITVDPSKAGGDFLAVMVTAEGIRIQMELPNGRRLTQNDAAAAGFQWEVAGPGQGDFGLIPGLQGKVNNLVSLPPKAPAGKYRVHADASNLKEDSALMVVFMPAGGGGIGVAGQRDTVRVAVSSTEKFHYAGERVQLVLGVFDGMRGINNAQVRAEAVAVDENGMPRGKRMPVKFRWSGVGADGSYSAELSTTAAGKYEVGINVRGKYADGTEFERNAATSISIEPRRAKLLDITEQPADEDGNGLIDRIDVTARVKVEVAGEYALIVDVIASTASTAYMQATARAALDVGERTITASFDRYSLLHVGADGPYQISARLFLKDGSAGQEFASLIENAGLTRAYKRSSFDHGPFYVAETAAATPRSATGSRPFDQLVVNVDVFTPGGTCYWYGDVRRDKPDVYPDGLDFATNRGELPKGAAQIALVFDGYKISDGADGDRLQIGDVAIECEPLRASLEKPIHLPAFPVGTFVKAEPGFDFYRLQQNYQVERGKANTMFLKIVPQGGFSENVDLAIEGLPDGIAVRNFPSSAPARLLGPNLLRYDLDVASDAALGHYKVTIRGKYKAMERAYTFTLMLDR